MATAALASSTAPTASGAAAPPASAPAPYRQRAILVSGYPPYTQPQDLSRVFSKFGAVKVDKISNKLASLVFSNEDEALDAIQASDKVNVYGEFLTVRPYNPDELVKPNNKGDPKGAKPNGAIIDPKEIDLSGDFHTQLEKVLAAVRLTQEAVGSLGRLYSDLEAVLRPQWPGCSAVPFGSITTGLGIKTSDADCFISVPPHFRNPNSSTFVLRTKRVLQQFPQVFQEILAIPRANTPIVKLFHVPTSTYCDVTFKTPLGARNSKLVAFLLHADPRLIPMAVLLKYWAKVHDLSGTGKLTNYALTLLVIFYLQQPPLSILPSVAWLQREEKYDLHVDFWNTGFMDKKDKLPACTNTSSVSELLGGFFEYYAAFNFEEMVVCPFYGSPLKKDIFKNTSQLPEEFERYKSNVLKENTLPLRFTTAMCVQDPFEQCHNVASPITSRLASEIKAFLKFAANAYEKEKLKECEGFLRTILLQKPKIIRGKTHPEYRVHLFPRIIVNIIDPEWKPIVRELIHTIFEKMLKVKLTKVDEKPHPDAKKEKEKYSASLKHAVWKRKQWIRIYSSMHKLNFQTRQERISDEIVKVEQPVDLQFQMTITYNNELRSSSVAVRLSNGDLAAFHEFGKFFMSILQHWFIELLKPYTRPAEKAAAASVADTIRELDGGSSQESDVDSPPSSPAHAPAT